MSDAGGSLLECEARLEGRGSGQAPQAITLPRGLFIAEGSGDPQARGNSHLSPEECTFARGKSCHPSCLLCGHP